MATKSEWELAQERDQIERIRARRLWVECSCCGERVTGEDVHLGDDEWTCLPCADRPVAPVVQLASLIGLAMLPILTGEDLLGDALIAACDVADLESEGLWD